MREEEEQEFLPKIDDPNVICIHVFLKHAEVPNEKIDLRILLHKERNVSDVVSRVAIWLKENFTFPYISFDLIYKNQIISNSKSLAEVGIIKDAKVFVFLKEPIPFNAAY